MATKEAYDEIFRAAQGESYPIIDDFEQAYGYAVDKSELENAARVLACPLKVNPPNWQHGRLIYVLARDYLANSREPVLFLDIGTAKGFSACVMSWAIRDANSPHHNRIVSIDVMKPADRVHRNSVAELDGLRTLYDFVEPYLAPDTDVAFLGCGSRDWLEAAVHERLHVGFAFVDGKHSYEAVTFECNALRVLQRPGDITIFDDLQIEPVFRAVRQLTGYFVTHIVTEAGRHYAVAVRQ